MRSTLSAISSSLELLRGRISHDDAIEKFVSIAGRQTSVLRRLLDDLQDVARIANGQISVVRDRVSLNSVVEGAVAASRPIIKAHRHRLVVEQPPDRLWVTGDEIRLVQVVVNLLNNAAKYTPDNGRIELTVTRDDQTAVISVRDDGIGIEHEMLDEIFGLFVQQRPSAHAGFGFGLTLVRRLVELHGGTVRARSDGPGRGSEFTLRLPLCAQ